MGKRRTHLFQKRRRWRWPSERSRTTSLVGPSFFADPVGLGGARARLDGGRAAADSSRKDSSGGDWRPRQRRVSVFVLYAAGSSSNRPGPGACYRRTVRVRPRSNVALPGLYRRGTCARESETKHDENNTTEKHETAGNSLSDRSGREGDALGTRTRVRRF